MNNKDYFRFIHDLYEFNDVENVPKVNIRLLKRKPREISLEELEQCCDPAGRNIERKRKKKKPLVEILAYCAMPNHYHLMIRQLVEDGIKKFMLKLNCGYAKYFNLKYDRVGPLFQGRFKSVLVSNDSHFYYLPVYIHLNPLDLVYSEWRNGFISNEEKCLKYLEKYRWSSFLDYIGRKNFPSIIKKDFLESSLGGPNKYKRSMIEWLKGMEENNKKITKQHNKIKENPFDLMNYDGLLLE